MTFGLEVGGGFQVPQETLQLTAQIPGLSLTGASLHATTDQTFGLALECSFSLLEVQAGPVGAGGVRWNLYRGRERIDTYHPLFHTLRIPEGTRSLRLVVEAWVRRSGRFFGLGRARHWHYPAQEFEVSFAGLEG